MDEKVKSMVIVIPALNEAKTIGDVINAASVFFPVIVVDDGSDDETALVASRHGATVVSLKKNMGVDFALATGFKTALKLGYEAVTTIDADGQHDPGLIPQISKPVLCGVADICHSDRNSYQRWSEYLLRKYSKRQHGYGDILSGLKAFNLSIYLLNPLMVSKDTMGTAIPWLAYSAGLKISEVKISTIDRDDKPRIGGIIVGNYRVCKALFRLILWDYFKRSRC
jgi:glycosyltransferase involved in cell wall biosynthesis